MPPRKKKGKEEVSELTPEEKCKQKLEGGYNDYMSVHNCCRFGMVDRLILLLDDPKNSFDTKEKTTGNTPIILACKHGHGGCARLLIEKGGVDVNGKGFKGMTALHHAARNDHQDIAALLVTEAKAEVDIEDDAGNTPLADAGRMGNLKVFENLLDVGADINHVNNAGSTPLMSAILNNRAAILDVGLLRGANLDVQDKKGDTALHYASRCGYGAAARTLVQQGARTDLANQAGTYAADCAVDKDIQAIIGPRGEPS